MFSNIFALMYSKDTCLVQHGIGCVSNKCHLLGVDKPESFHTPTSFIQYFLLVYFFIYSFIEKQTEIAVNMATAAETASNLHQSIKLFSTYINIECHKY